MPLSSFDGVRLGNTRLALRTVVSLTSFRLAWDWHAQWPGDVPESLAAEMADDADRCNDLREMNREYANSGEAEAAPRTRVVHHARVPAGV